jgi:hypothetical protein
MAFDKKQKRSFHTVLSGLSLSKYGGRSIRFLTLTTSSLCKESIDYGNGSLNRDFQTLKQRVKRYSPYRLVKEGYLTRSQARYFYRADNYFKKFSFEYFKVLTSEGNGVLHVLCRGSYLPYNFLSDNWFDIHLSFDVNIKLIDLKKPVDGALYVVGQYVSSQNSSYVRSSQSWHWVCRGFKTIWYGFCRWYPDKRFALWDNYLKKLALDLFFPQAMLTDFG